MIHWLIKSKGKRVEHNCCNAISSDGLGQECGKKKTSLLYTNDIDVGQMVKIN
jgi:hypothetical protein